MTFGPVHDRSLVRRATSHAKTGGGIVIPDTEQEKRQELGVAAVGPGILGENGTITPLDVRAGNRILFGNGQVPKSGPAAMILSL